MKDLLVAHDAGGAEILCAWLQTEDGSAHVIAEGPAARIFMRESFSLLHPESVNIASYDRVITGTSCGARLENQYLELARRCGIKSIAVVDHWLHYPERFQNCGYPTLPDEIWACDTSALALVRQCFPDLHVVLQPNWYWEKIRSRVKPGLPAHWLIALENRQLRGQTWRESLDAALEWLSAKEQVVQVVVRPHPIMKSTEIEDYISGKHHQFSCTVSQADLVEDLSACESVLGYQTTVLALARVCGKRAVSLVRGDERLVVPLSGIDRPFH